MIVLALKVSHQNIYISKFTWQLANKIEEIPSLFQIIWYGSWIFKKNKNLSV